MWAVEQARASKETRGRGERVGGEGGKGAEREKEGEEGGRGKEGRRRREKQRQRRQKTDLVVWQSDDVFDALVQAVQRVVRDLSAAQRTSVADTNLVDGGDGGTICRLPTANLAVGLKSSDWLGKVEVEEDAEKKLDGREEEREEKERSGGKVVALRVWSDVLYRATLTVNAS